MILKELENLNEINIATNDFKVKESNLKKQKEKLNNSQLKNITKGDLEDVDKMTEDYLKARNVLYQVLDKCIYSFFK